MRVLKGLLAGAAADAIALGTGTPALADSGKDHEFTAKVTPTEVSPGETVTIVATNCSSSDAKAQSPLFAPDNMVPLEASGQDSAKVGRATIAEDPQGDERVKVICPGEGAKPVFVPLTVVDESDDQDGDNQDGGDKKGDDGDTEGDGGNGDESKDDEGSKGDDSDNGGGTQDDGKIGDEGDSGDETSGGDQEESPEPSTSPDGDAPELMVTIIDGFVGKKRDVSFGVTGCVSKQLSASSVAFASTSVDKESQIITAILKQGLDFGWYDVTFKCAGQASKTLSFKYTNEMTDDNQGGGSQGSDKPNGDDTVDGNDQTTRIPEGAAQTGGGATAGATATAGALQ